VNRSRPQAKAKSFDISKWMVQEAYQRVKANKGAPGADGVTIEQFEQDLQGNLYKLWDRMSSGSYFPPAVKGVEIPKAGGRGVRLLGVPAVADRVAQTAAAMALEARTESIFHEDSCGYRPRRGALDAVAKCRLRCWKKDWVIDLDVGKFFDSVPWDLMVKAVEANITASQKWVLLYVKRWLAAPVQLPDGTLAVRDRGTAQGSAVSPVLANLFMHYAFDLFLAREFPAALTSRMEEAGLQLHPAKTKIVYCKDANRRRLYEHTSFTFPGYTFRPRLAISRAGRHFVSFLPAASKEAIKAMGQVLRSWHLANRSDKTLADLARMFNNVVQGWINYYGRFYQSGLHPLLRRINDYLVRWACRKFKRLRRRRRLTWCSGTRSRSCAGKSPVRSRAGLTVP
jgi:RNA-directed DNA polymerase